MPLKFSATTTQFDTIRIFSWWHQARLQAERGAETDAIATLRRLNRDYPQVVESWHLLGQLLRRRGESKEAAHCFARGAQLNPKALEELHRDRLELLLEMGRMEEFEAARELAKKNFPSFTPPPWKKDESILPSPLEGSGKETRVGDNGGGVKEGRSPLLSLCLIVKNEMANLPACLDSAEGLADEIVVVDTGSTDGTAEWAERRGVKVERMAWQNDFSAARNRSLDAAQGRWILWLDADDRLLSEDKAAIRALAEKRDAVPRAYGFLIQNTPDGGKTGSVFNQIRLFPNRPGLRFSGPVHEQILPAIEKAGLPVEYSPIRILHTGYADPAAARAKQIRNRNILEAQIRAGNGVTAVTRYTLGMACLDLEDPEEALRNFATAASLALDTGTNPHISAIAPVKSAVALAQLKRYAEALDALDIAAASRPREAELPEAALVRAQVLQAMQREEEARTAFEKLFAYRQGPTFTPVDFPLLKIHALRFLAEYWHAHGHPDLGVRLLRAGISLKEGADFTPENLRQAYADLTLASRK
jgi:tetratricopeptide (TPR) repeat protein